MHFDESLMRTVISRQYFPESSHEYRNEMEHSHRIDLGHVSPGETSGFCPRRDRSIAYVVGISLSQQLNTRNLVPRRFRLRLARKYTRGEGVKVRGPGRDACDKESPSGEREYVRMLGNDSSGPITRKCDP